MGLKLINTPQSSSSITVDKSISPNTENACHYQLYKNISNLEKMVDYKSPKNENGDYYTRHQNFIHKFEPRNNGKVIINYNENIIGVDPSFQNSDFFVGDLSGYSTIEKAYLRQQQCVVLLKKSIDVPIPFKMNTYNLSHVSSHTNVTSKLFIKGLIDYVDNPLSQNYDYTNLGPLFGIILTHNGDEDIPEFLVLGINPSTYQLGYYYYNYSIGFQLIETIVDQDINNLECNFGWINNNFMVYRNNKKIPHYGKELNSPTTNYLETMYYHYHNSIVDNTQIEGVFNKTFSTMNYQSPIHIGLYICPELNIRIQNFDFGFDMVGY